MRRRSLRDALCGPTQGRTHAQEHTRLVPGTDRDPCGVHVAEQIAGSASRRTHAQTQQPLNTTASREGDDPPPEPPLAHRQSHRDGVTSLVDWGHGHAVTEHDGLRSECPSRRPIKRFNRWCSLQLILRVRPVRSGHEAADHRPPHPVNRQLGGWRGKGCIAAVLYWIDERARDPVASLTRCQPRPRTAIRS